MDIYVLLVNEIMAYLLCLSSDFAYFYGADVFLLKIQFHCSKTYHTSKNLIQGKKLFTFLYS
jgi:hypothetical protein